MEGISPDNRLLERLSEFRLINPPISNGMSPVSLLLDKSKPRESVYIENSSRGMPPYKLLEERLSVVSCLQPSKLRYEPSQIIFLEKKFSKRSKFPIDLGISPECWFLDMVRMDKFWRLPSVSGIFPERKLLSN